MFDLFVPYIVRSIRRDRIWGIGITTLGIVGELAYGFLLDHRPILGWVVIALLFFLPGGFILIANRHSNPAKTKIGRLLSHPEKIVWIYPQLTRATFGPATLLKGMTIFVYGQEGWRTAAGLAVRGDEFDYVMELLRRLAPHATFGYSDALQKRFLQGMTKHA